MEQTGTLDRLGDALEAAAQRNMASPQAAEAGDHRGRGRGRGARAGSGDRRREADLERRRGEQLAGGDALARGHGADLHHGERRRRVPLRAGEGARTRGVRLEGHGRADGRQDQARERRVPLAGQRRHDWECYIGQAAVDQQIIGAGFLGEFAPSPGQG